MDINTLIKDVNSKFIEVPKLSFVAITDMENNYMILHSEKKFCANKCETLIYCGKEAI